MTFRHVGACAVLGVALMGVLSAQSTVQSDRQFQAALQKEMVDGDLKGAIAAYGAIASRQGVGRDLAAQALLRMAGCHQKLGDAEAQGIYQRIVRDFPEQADAVALARTRLGSLSPGVATGDRVVWRGSETTYGVGRVSADGRYISYVTYAGPKGLNLKVRDLTSNTDRTITDVDWTTGEASDSTFSPDGKQLAYGWTTYARGTQPKTFEIRVATLDGTAAPRTRSIYASVQHNTSPLDWAPDGKTLAVRVELPDRTKQIALLGLEGSFRVLKTVDNWRGVNKMFFSPDGKYLAYDTPTSETDQRRDVFIIAVDGSGELPVYDPADDVVMGWSPDRRVLFASDRTGRVDLWALSVSNGKPAGPPTLVKPDIGTVESQGLTASGALFTVKDASTVNFQIAPIDLERGRLTGAPLLQVFRAETPSWSRDGRFLAYQARGANGQAHLAIRELASNRVRELHPPLVYMPQLQWFSGDGSLIAAGRDTKGRNSVMRIDVETGKAEPVSQNGQVSADGRKMYYSVGPNNRAGVVFEEDLTTDARREVFRKPDATGALRLSPDGKLIAMIKSPVIDSTNPTAKTSSLIIASVADGTLREVVVPAVLDTYRGFDWTPDAHAIVVAAEAPDAALWLVAVTGAAPKKMEIDTSKWGTGMGIRLHPNGKQIAYFTGDDAREVWALENVLSAGPRR